MLPSVLSRCDLPPPLPPPPPPQQKTPLTHTLTRGRTELARSQGMILRPAHDTTRQHIQTARAHSRSLSFVLYLDRLGQDFELVVLGLMGVWYVSGT